MTFKQKELKKEYDKIIFSLQKEKKDKISNLIEDFKSIHNVYKVNPNIPKWQNEFLENNANGLFYGRYIKPIEVEFEAKKLELRKIYLS